MTTENTAAKICICAICGDWTFEGQALADYFVFEKYDPAELDFIEIAHVECVKTTMPRERWNNGRGRSWEFTE